MGEKVGEKLGEKVGENTGEKVGESLGEIHKLNLCRIYIGAMVFILVPWYLYWCHGNYIGALVFKVVPRYLYWCETTVSNNFHHCLPPPSHKFF